MEHTHVWIGLKKSNSPHSINTIKLQVSSIQDI